MSIKAVGEGSVLTEDKACQAYDVPWRDYEKCIGYSLVTKSEYNPETKKSMLSPVVVPDENFGKYQEQFLFYLQHIEDHGIETDETKGLPDPNHIPLKDLIDGTSPFIMDMLERLSPVTLSNGCTSPSRVESSNNEKTASDFLNTSPIAVDTSPASSDDKNNDNQSIELTTMTTMSVDASETEEKSSEDNVPTSKAVQELQKMVTKLQEDLRSSQTIEVKDSETEKKDEKNIELKAKAFEEETLSAVNSILKDELELNSDTWESESNDKCTTLE